MSPGSSTGVAPVPQPKGNGDSQPPLVSPENRQPSRKPTSLTFVASPSNSPKANSFEKEKAQVDSIPQILGVQSPQSKADAEREEKERWAYRIGFPRWVILRKAAKILCLLGLGTPNVDRILHMADLASRPGADGAEWRDFMQGLFNRAANVNVVSSLILATTAAFLTTDPPTSIAIWTHPMPYVTLMAAFCLGFLSVGCGTFLLFVLSDAQAAAFKDLAHRPWRFWSAICLLGAPTIFVGMAGLSGILALCFSVWHGDNLFAKMGLTLTITVTFTVIGFFGAVVV
ncbi:hypothetical protein QCA50_003740 [Cerrena zonata]|uniref:Yip1 domain-containing protein n=1 Tax=Cerrena zonata TaxID=2478898 RepID=A0AAW0GFH8_9APHY